MKGRLLLLSFLLLGFATAVPAAGEDTFFDFGNGSVYESGNDMVFQFDGFQEPPPSPDLYVSPSGDDSNRGTLEAPFRTLDAAIASLTRYTPGDVVTIWLRGGTYVIEQTVQIERLQNLYVDIRAYEKEIPILTGAVPLEGFEETKLQGRTVWAVPYEGPQLRMLLSDNGPRPVSRWPKEGGMLSVLRPVTKAETKIDNQMGFYVRTRDLPKNVAGATVRLLHWWKDELSGVFTYDRNNGLLLMNRPTAMAVEKDDKYWLENVLGAPLEPGEWAHDVDNGMLYYAPREGEMLESTPLYAGKLEKLLSLNDVANFTFRGIMFSGTGWSIPYNDTQADFPQAAYDAGAAITVQNAINTRFERCTFKYIGSGCIQFGRNINSAVVNGCTFENIGAHAVYAHGINDPDERAVTENIIISNNHINSYGRNFLNAAAVLIIHARNVEIAHNEIHGGTYTAISAGWVWGEGYNITGNIRILNNWLYDIGRGLLSDMGAVYLLGGQAGTVVAGNIIHDVTGAEYGGWGIYLDEGSNYITVTNNLVYSCSAQGYHQHDGVYNTVVNNIFAFNQDGQVGASAKGTFLLDQNVIVGKDPFLRKGEGSSIKMGENLFTSDPSIFVDTENGNFNIRDAHEVTRIGFQPWVLFAGRYASLE